ncbi:MAG TPA: hypothetical protein VMQ93_08280 [Novosphingobium sp.]|nr:hypothetical protein [Novosphingobium sp.]
MSRSWLYLFAFATLAPAPAIAQSAPAQSSSQSAEDRAIAEKMIGAGGRITPDKIRNSCANPTRQGEIVVCAPNREETRVPSTRDERDQSLDENDLAPADVAGRGIFRGKTTATFGSVEQPYIIDLSTIPIAPAGSDADKIAKGELRAP